MKDTGSRKRYHEMDCPEEFAYGDMWANLIIPQGSVMDQMAIRLLKEDRIRVQEIPRKDFDYLMEKSEGDHKGDRILEMVHGCETGAVLYSSGLNMFEKLNEIHERNIYGKTLKR